MYICFFLSSVGFSADILPSIRQVAPYIAAFVNYEYIFDNYEYFYNDYYLLNLLCFYYWWNVSFQSFKLINYNFIY
jgi:hypothetical protein